MSDLSEITVAILAGGLGTRLQSVVKDKPKVLAEVSGHPFLEYILEQLNKNSFKSVVFCTGYLANQIESTFGKRYKNLNLLYSSEQVPLGSAGGLRKALPLLDSETILVMNGDSFCDIDFEKFLHFHKEKKSNATLVVSSVSDTSQSGTVELNSDGTITSFLEKSGNKEGTVSVGVYLINRSFIEKIPEKQNVSLEKEVFPDWIGMGFYGLRVDNSFIDIGTPENYKKAEQFFLK